MEIRNLSTFLQVAMMKNFTKAGEVLGYSQSNVSAQVKQLEDELGVPLFNRVGRSITLTQYGEDLVEYAQSIVSTAAIIENIMQKKETTGGTLRLGIVESLYECIFKTAFTEYHELYPMVDVVVTVGATADLLVMLSNNQIDAACLIDYPLSNSKWNILYSKECEIAIVAGSAHRLSSEEKLSLNKLADEEFIMMEDTCSYTGIFQKILEDHKLNVFSVLTIQDPGTAIELIQEGKYLSLLPLYSVRKYVNEGKIKLLDFPQLQLHQAVQIIAHRNRAVVSRTEGFVAIAKKLIDVNIIK